MRRTTAISLIFGALLGGVALGRIGFGLPVWMVAVVAMLVTAVFLVARRWLVLALVILAAAIGLWRGQAYLDQRAELTNLIGQKISVTGVVADDPAYDPRGFMDFRLAELCVDGRPIAGEIRVHMNQINLHRGYRVGAEGKLKPGFGNIAAEFSYPKLTVISAEQSWLEKFRQRFIVGMKTALAEPLASFGLGLLVGVRALIPKDLQAQLALVGLSHLVAVSGYNLTIIVVATQRLLERFGRGVALAASFWLIGGFLLITGASASIVRASLVAALALLATFYGRRFNPLVRIAIAAGLTAAWQPSYLTDLGWLLSFLAFFGIMVLAPAVSARLGSPKPLLVRIFIETTAAQLMTIPLVLYIFGQLSVVAPLTNLIILPMVPLVMLFCFIAGLAGMTMPAFAGWLAWPAQLLLGFMLDLVKSFAGFSWAATTVKIGWPEMLSMYALILIIILTLYSANRRLGRETAEIDPTSAGVHLA